MTTLQSVRCFFFRFDIVHHAFLLFSQVTLNVLLALRFMALVLEEARNLALGLAVRGVNWQAMGPGAGLTVSPAWLHF